MSRTPHGPMRAAATRSGPAYDAAYYAHYYARGGPEQAYERTAEWLGFFGQVADHIVVEFAPSTSLDVGCAHGFLVESLRDREVDARGFDVSEFAISQARDDIRPYTWVGSVLAPIPGHYDLVTCIEVLEHVEERDADTAVANICAVTDDILFTSTPDDFDEPTHVNVRPSDYWSELFARHGFVRDPSFDASFLAWWGMRYRRRREGWPRVLADHDRELARLKSESHQNLDLILHQRQENGELRARVDQLETGLGEARNTLDGITHSRSYRLASFLSKMLHRVLPPHRAR